MDYNIFIRYFIAQSDLNF